MKDVYVQFKWVRIKSDVQRVLFRSKHFKTSDCVNIYINNKSLNYENSPWNYSKLTLVCSTRAYKLQSMFFLWVFYKTHHFLFLSGHNTEIIEIFTSKTLYVIDIMIINVRTFLLDLIFCKKCYNLMDFREVIRSDRNPHLWPFSRYKSIYFMKICFTQNRTWVPTFQNVIKWITVWAIWTRKPAESLLLDFMIKQNK